MALGAVNLNQLLKKFDDLQDIDLEVAVGKGIKLVQGKAKEGCPSDHGELRGSIFIDVEHTQGMVRGTCFTNKEYAAYVEFGTGPRGQENHANISPNANPVYHQGPWWIHESQIGRETAEKYRWFYIDTPEGRFYQCSGQAAHPFMYPALKNSEDDVLKAVAEHAVKVIGRKIK